MWWAVCCMFVFCTQQVLTDEYTLPSYISVCYRNDPQVSECLKKEIEKLLPLFKTGAKEFDLDSIDPIEFSDMAFKYNNFLIGGTSKIPKATAYGLTKMKVLDVRARLNNPEKFFLDFDVHLDKMRIAGGYKLKGNVQFISVDMEGNVDMDLGDINLTFFLEGTLKPGSNGSDFLHLDSFRWRLRGDGVGTMSILNDDLVHNRPILNSFVLAVARSPAWRLINNSMLPTLLPEADKNLKKTFTKFFSKYPYDVIFPKDPPK